MFACLYVPPAPATRGASSFPGEAPDVSVLLDVARMVSPRVAAHSSRQILVDIEGLERLLGDSRAIGERLRQAAADRGIAPVHVAVAGTYTAAVLLAAAKAGVTVVAPGEEGAALAPLPLRTLAVLASEEIEARSQPASPKPAGRPFDEGGKPEARRRNATPESRIPNPESRIPSPGSLAVLARWGLRTLGELAALPAADLSERLGQDGIRWQRLARGEDTGPLAPAVEEEPFEASLQLEWPIEELEPLSFVLTRLLEPLCRRLEHRDRGAAMLHLRLRLVTRDLHLRSLQLPAPMRDPKVLRTLLLLDLESHSAPAGIDAVTVSIDPTPGRIVQESLLTRARPAPELVSTLVARLQALMGEGKSGSPMTVDSYRPGAFAMVPFVVEAPFDFAQGKKASTSISNAVTPRRGAGDARTAKGASLSRPSSQAAGRSSQNASQGPKSAWGRLRFARGSVEESQARMETPQCGVSRGDEVGPRAAADGTPEMRFAGLRERAGERDVPVAATLRRFRLPIPARVLMEGSRPLSVRTDRPALAGGRVQAAAGPWRTSGEWWKTPATPAGAQPTVPTRRAGWNRDEWDVALSDGGLYRIFEDRETGRWFVGAVVD